MENAILLYCPFLFIENLTFPSFISLPIWLTTKSKSYLNMKMRKFSLFLISLLLCTLSLRYWLRLFAFFVPSNQIKSNNTSNRFNFIVTPTSGKDLWPPSQKWNNDSTFRKTKDCRQHVLVTYAKRALKVGSLLVTVRVLKVQRLE